MTFLLLLLLDLFPDHDPTEKLDPGRPFLYPDDSMEEEAASLLWTAKEILGVQERSAVFLVSRY